MSERTLATLNLAQQGTVCLGLLCAMLAAARRVAAGAMSVGDFVMVHARLRFDPRMYPHCHRLTLTAACRCYRYR